MGASLGKRVLPETDVEGATPAQPPDAAGQLPAAVGGEGSGGDDSSEGAGADEDAGADEGAGADDEAGPAMSKSQAKKAKRHEVRRAAFAAKKLRKKEKKREGAPAAAFAAPQHPQRQREDGAPVTRKEDVHRLIDAQARGAELPSLLIDLCHDDLQNPGERSSLTQQVMYSYGMNKRTEHPLPLHLTSVCGEAAASFGKIDGFNNWHLHRHEQPYWEVFPKASLVVLSADATEVLRELEPGKIYVIGGIVDHNRHKGDAEAHGLASARLPLTEYSEMASRKVLTVNHVFQMLLHFYSSKSWPEAILAAVPPRKGLQLKRGLGEV
ncbi:guanine-1-methyltransferase-domain-containing protein [Pavlovales sp. CCMP2436]|nr:guanine-1-methyltransferase-domain-containing protein [Pavlovales sp. CCMP2436]